MRYINPEPPPCPQIENTLSTYDPHAVIVVYSVDDRESFQDRASNEGSRRIHNHGEDLLLILSHFIHYAKHAHKHSKK